MSVIAFTRAMEALAFTQTLHVDNLRKISAAMMDLGFTAEQIEPVIGPIDEIEDSYRLWRSTLCLLNEETA